MKKLTPIALALALAFPVSAQAQSTSDLKKEIDLLKAQIAELKQMVVQRAAAPAPAPAPVAAAPVDSTARAELAALRIKVDAMDDAHVESGFEGLKVSGFIDPTYIYNQRTGRGSVLFLNDVGGETNDLSSDAFGFANSNFGGVTLKFEKSFDNGMMAMMSLRPSKAGSDTLVEEALVTVPLKDGVSFIAGKQISWNGYELVNSPDMKNITHNLLYDFAGPFYAVGAGLTFSALDMDWKTMIGTLNNQVNLPGRDNHNGGFHWRGDMELSEFSGWGISGMHGTLGGENYHYLDIDYWYTRGDWSFNAQLEGSRHDNMAFDGGDASHVGASALAALKLGDGWEAVLRADWLDEHKNGGSLYRSGFDCSNLGGTTGADDDGDGVYDAADTCGDYRNGFGPQLVNIGDPLALGSDALALDTRRGAKRSALTFGLNYQFHENALLKFELRYDHSDLNSFYDFSTGTFKKSAATFGAQTVVKF